MKDIRFLHIPKTAGSTFRRILRRQYFNSVIFSFSGILSYDKQKYNLTKFKNTSLKLFFGHAPIITGIEDADKADMITFLRDPISRVKSFCQYVSEGKSPYLIKDFPPEKFDLGEFLNSGNEELSNLQTKMLINTESCKSSGLINKMKFNETKEKALDNLYNKIVCYGIQEYFDESIILFSNILRWRLPFYVSVNKKNKSKLLKFEEHHLKKIKELNSIDIEVYNAARLRFENIINGHKFSNFKLKLFKILNIPASKILNLSMKVKDLLKK